MSVHNVNRADLSVPIFNCVYLEQYPVTHPPPVQWDGDPASWPLAVIAVCYRVSTSIVPTFPRFATPVFASVFSLPLVVSTGSRTASPALPGESGSPRRVRPGPSCSPPRCPCSLLRSWDLRARGETATRAARPSRPSPPRRPRRTHSKIWSSPAWTGLRWVLEVPAFSAPQVPQLRNASHVLWERRAGRHVHLGGECGRGLRIDVTAAGIPKLFQLRYFVKWSIFSQVLYIFEVDQAVLYFNYTERQIAFLH